MVGKIDFLILFEEEKGDCTGRVNLTGLHFKCKVHPGEGRKANQNLVARIRQIKPLATIAIAFTKNRKQRGKGTKHLSSQDRTTHTRTIWMIVA